jgi:hypothetical protein
VSTLYQIRTPAPVLLERGRAHVRTIEVYRGGSLSAPSAATYALLDETGATVKSGAASIVSSVATYTLAAVDLPSTLALGEGYQERWVLTLADGSVRHVRRDVSVALFSLFPPVDQAAIISGEYPDLLHDLGPNVASLDGFLDAAWYHVVRRLHKHGSWPGIVVEASDVYDWHLHVTCHRIFKALALAPGTENERFADLREYHDTEAKNAESSLRIKVDRDASGLADDLGRHGVGVQSVHANVPHVANPRNVPRKWG